MTYATGALLDESADIRQTLDLLKAALDEHPPLVMAEIFIALMCDPALPPIQPHMVRAAVRLGIQNGELKLHEGFSVGLVR